MYGVEMRRHNVAESGEFIYWLKSISSGQRLGRQGYDFPPMLDPISRPSVYSED
jgi:hypothetical protein